MRPHVLVTPHEHKDGSSKARSYKARQRRCSKARQGVSGQGLHAWRVARWHMPWCRWLAAQPTDRPWGSAAAVTMYQACC